MTTFASRADWRYAWLTTAAAAALVLLAATRGSIWTQWAPATCWPDHCFCEAVGAGLVRQPVNTVSSLLFFVPAILIRHRQTDPTFARIYAGGLAVTGAGSAFYHASLSFAGQTADVFGMYLIGTFAVLAAASRLVRLGPLAAAALYAGTNAALLAVLLEAPALRRYLFAALLIGAVGLELAGPPRSRRWLWLTLGAVSVGFGFWAIDLTRLVCAPGSRLQGHAVWHACSALAAGLYYRHAAARTPA